MRPPRRRMRWLAVGMAAVLATLVLPAAGPASAAPVYIGHGFDTCAAPSLNAMTAWLASPYRSLGIYIGGANRACGDGNLSARWVSTVEGQGWSLAPLYVGLQAPCVSQGGLATIDAGSEASEGAAAADDAAARAARFGIPAGNAIYFDMEGYGSDASCVQTVQAFLSAWTGELHQLGYLAGVYGSSASTIHDQAHTPYANPVDEVWFANWNDTPNIFGDPFFPDTMWTANQRLHQYQGDTSETYGGVLLNIDKDYSQGAQAGPSSCNVPTALPAAAAAATVGTAAAVPAWSPWLVVRPAPCPSGSGPAVASWAAGRLDVFNRGADGHLWHSWSANAGASMSAWEDLGSPPGGMASSPTAVSWGPGRIDVLAQGADGKLWQTSYSGWHWQAWLDLGGILTSAPAVTSWGPGRLDVVAKGADQAIWHRWYDGAWHSWESLGGRGTLDPGVATWGAGRLDAFTVGTDTRLYHRFFAQGQWSSWNQEVAGTWSSGPGASSVGSNRIDLFLESQATGNPMSHIWWSGGWHVESLDGSLTAKPAAVGSAGRIDTFVRGTDANIWHKWWAAA